MRVLTQDEACKVQGGIMIMGILTLTASVVVAVAELTTAIINLCAAKQGVTPLTRANSDVTQIANDTPEVTQTVGTVVGTLYSDHSGK